MNPIAKTATSRYLRPILFGRSDDGHRFVDGDLGTITSTKDASAVCFGCGHEICSMGLIFFGYDPTGRNGNMYLHLNCGREIAGELQRMCEAAALEGEEEGVLHVGNGVVG